MTVFSSKAQLLPVIWIITVFLQYFTLNTGGEYGALKEEFEKMNIKAFKMAF